MDLVLSKKADYVLRAAIALGRASADGEWRKVRELAAEMALPARYTPQILGLLVRGGIAESRAGTKGGYRLIRAPEDVTVLELVEIGEGPLWPRRCTLDGGPCRWETVCAVHPAWEQAYQAITSALQAVSLASVVAVDRQLESGHEFTHELSHPELTPRLPAMSVTAKPSSKTVRRKRGTTPALPSRPRARR
jgi:Rrf2 family iron-sulfur cluster assembly transcriptional regulator